MSDEVRGIEELIRDAIRRGEFDNLRGKGKPLDLDAHFQAPEELRVGYSMLRDAGFVPEEVQLLKDIGDLREQLKNCADEGRRKELSKELRDKGLNYSLLVERARKSK
jgi:hypothetical protein